MRGLKIARDIFEDLKFDYNGRSTTLLDRFMRLMDEQKGQLQRDDIESYNPYFDWWFDHHCSPAYPQRHRSLSAAIMLLMRKFSSTSLFPYNGYYETIKTLLDTGISSERFIQMLAAQAKDIANTVSEELRRINYLKCAYALLIVRQIVQGSERRETERLIELCRMHAVEYDEGDMINQQLDEALERE